MEKDLSCLAILIPAYKPESSLINLSQELIAQGFNEIIIVNDGSGLGYEQIFIQLREMGCRILEHAVNMGKGRALKTGMNDLLVHNTQIVGVITADADGQHLVKDIVNVGNELLNSHNTIVLGKRTFSGNVPLKSRFGNTITKNVYNFISGQKLNDTQTGLRGLPYSSLKNLLTLKGERYEYEMNVLLEASNYQLNIKEIDIETVYLNGNINSHFNPLTDSWRIYRLIILFGGSSLFAFLVDFLIFTLITIILPGVLWAAVVGARVVSSFVNFFVNRNIIFSNKNQSGNLQKHLLGYFTLVIFILAANYGLITLFTSVGINVFLSKIITELLLFFVSFSVQKRIIFK
ncbi:MAG: GtrA family protein [Christensenellales bacterium]|jgi:glycosyltransferase involved in cell wall biosynthesis